jgi:hypothetical protein
LESLGRKKAAVLGFNDLQINHLSILKQLQINKSCECQNRMHFKLVTLGFFMYLSSLKAVPDFGDINQIRAQIKAQ